MELQGYWSGFYVLIMDGGGWKDVGEGGQSYPIAATASSNRRFVYCLFVLRFDIECPGRFCSRYMGKRWAAGGYQQSTGIRVDLFYR